VPLSGMYSTRDSKLATLIFRSASSPDTCATMPGRVDAGDLELVGQVVGERGALKRRFERQRQVQLLRQCWAAFSDG
jgi:hypothetical protein